MYPWWKEGKDARLDSNSVEEEQPLRDYRQQRVAVGGMGRYSGHCLSRELQCVLSNFCPLANIRVAPSTDVLPRKKKSTLVQVNRAVLLSCCLLAGVCGEASQGPSA